MKPSRENVYTYKDAQGKRIAILVDGQFYSTERLDDDGIAETINGGDVLPLVPAQLKATMP